MGKRILVTGATGFFGRHLVPSLVGHEYSVRAATRRPVMLGEAVEVVSVGDFTQDVDWIRHVDGMDAVIHLAALAHVNKKTSSIKYDEINRKVTVRLAKAAAAVDARFIFMSSIAAQTGSSASEVLTEDSRPFPTTAYGRSKLLAEQEIATIGNDFIILRPALTYGYGVKGNMERVIKLATRRFSPLLGSIRNSRSLLAVENMCEAVNFFLTSNSVTKQIFILSDPEPVSMAEIVCLLRSGAGLNTKGLHIPPVVLAVSLRLLGRDDLWKKIGENLVVSPEKLRRYGFQWKTGTTEAMPKLSALYANSSPALDADFRLTSG